MLRGRRRIVWDPTRPAAVRSSPGGRPVIAGQLRCYPFACEVAPTVLGIISEASSPEVALTRERQPAWRAWSPPFASQVVLEGEAYGQRGVRVQVL